MGLGVRSVDRVARLLSCHDLVRPLPPTRILEAVDHAVAMAATATTTAYQCLHARLRGFRPEMLDRHMFETRDLAKVHAFRGGFFVVRREDLATFLAASAPGRETVCRAYRRHHGVTDVRWRRLRDVAIRTLGRDAMDARDLAKAMGVRKLPPTFLRMLSVEGTFVPWTPVHAPSWESASHRLAVRSVLFPDSDPDAVDLERSQTLLLRRYLQAYGPASVRDIGWWLDTGTKLVERLLDGIRRGLAWTTDLDTSQELVGLARCMPLPSRGIPPVLVPAGDHVPRAFRERDFLLRPEWYNQVVTRDGNPKASVWIGGEIRGRWRVVRQGGIGHVVVWRFAPLSRQTERALAASARQRATFGGARPGKVYFEDYPPGLPASGGKPPLPGELAAAMQEA